MFRSKKILFLFVFLFFMIQAFSRAQEIDYATYSTLLEKYVSEGEIDYLAWVKNDFTISENYIKSLENVSIDTMNNDERKAFWINAYNALTIYAVLKRIPKNRILAKAFSVQMVPGFFDGITYVVAGESLTLNDIENQKLRGSFNDSRIHFAIVCASRSCPKIQNKVFMSSGLDERLEEATRLFIQDQTRNRLDREKGTLSLSQIFKWYEIDFRDDANSVINYIKKYLSFADAQYIASNTVSIKYLFYNWLVNIKD